MGVWTGRRLKERSEHDLFHPGSAKHNLILANVQAHLICALTCLVLEYGRTGVDVSLLIIQVKIDLQLFVSINECDLCPGPPMLTEQ